MIAAVCTWHEHHERAIQEITRRLDRGEEMIVASCALHAKVTTLLTFNEQHFAPFRAKGIAVVVP
jgi:hypothetical protein